VPAPRGMKLPKSAPAAVRLFEELVPADPSVTTKKMFGQPAAFVNGNLFFGVFGDDVFVRLSGPDVEEARRVGSFRPFEPMPGRAMSNYLVLPRTMRKNSPETQAWVARALTFGSSLPPKKSKAR
jgi:TfoX/Sxy family transcriptional regulator of competence genes